MAIDKVLKLVFKAEDQTAKGITNAKGNVDKFNKAAKESGSGIGGAVEQADKLEATLGKVVKIGVVLELGIAGIKAGMSGVRALSAGLSGDIDKAGKAAEELGKAVSEIPVVGKLVGVGEELNNLFTGAKDQTERLNKSVEAMNKNLELTAKYIDAARAAGNKLSGVQLGIANARELAATVESQRAIVAARQEYEAAVEKANLDQQKNLSEANRQYQQNSALDEIRELDKKIAEAKEVVSRVENDTNTKRRANDLPLVEKSLSDLYAKRARLLADANVGSIESTESVIKIQTQKELEAAKAIYDEKVKLAEESNKKQFDLFAKSLQDQIELAKQKQKNSNINDKYDRQLADIDTNTDEQIRAVQAKYRELLAKYDGNSAEADRLRAIQEQELAVVAAQSQQQRQSVEADRLTAQYTSEVEQAQEAARRQQQATEARATAAKALADIERTILETRAAAGDSQAAKALEQNRIAERYLSIQNQINEALKNQNLTETERNKLKEMANGLDGSKANELAGIGKKETTKETGGLTARLFSQDRTIGVSSTSPELIEAKEQTKLATKSNNLLERILYETQNNRLVVG